MPAHDERDFVLQKHNLSVIQVIDAPEVVYDKHGQLRKHMKVMVFLLIVVFLTGLHALTKGIQKSIEYAVEKGFWQKQLIIACVIDFSRQRY